MKPSGTVGTNNGAFAVRQYPIRHFDRAQAAPPRIKSGAPVDMTLEYEDYCTESFNKTPDCARNPA